MRRENAEREAEARQAEDRTRTYRAMRRGDAWAVAVLPIRPNDDVTGTATRPPPVAPQEGPPDREVRGGLWGSAG